MDGTPKDEIAEGYYFSADAGIFTRLTYFFLALFTVVLSVVSILAPLTTPACPTEKGVTTKHPNPDYIVDDCRFVRYAILCGLSKFEADSCVRILVSIFCGSVIGFERRRPDRPAGVRTMALVCLGSCVFTIDSMWAFIDGPMAWDASRVAAAIPSGVGFLGAATIWKGTASKQDGGEPTAPEVHGLTTATSVWLSAAIGILCGGALYAPALFTTAASVVYLRFAPRMPKPKDGNGNSHHGASSPVAPSLEGLAAGVLSQSLREPLVQAEHRSAASGATPGESPIKGDSSGSFSNKGSPRRTDRSSKGSAGLHL